MKRRKNHFEILSEMCIVLEGIAQDKSVSKSLHEGKMMEALTNVLQAATSRLKDQRPTFMLFSGDGPYCFVKKMSRDYEIEKPLRFLKIFSANSNQPHRACTKQNHSTHSIALSTAYRLIESTKNSIPFSFYTRSVYSKST